MQMFSVSFHWKKKSIIQMD